LCRNNILVNMAAYVIPGSVCVCVCVGGVRWLGVSFENININLKLCARHNLG